MTDIDPERLERVARQIAAIKMGLVRDIFGEDLPDDLWRQAIPDAQRRIEASDQTEPRYYVEREDMVTAPDRPDYFVMDRQTGLAVDVSTIEARALSYCDTLNRRDAARA